MSEIKKSDDVQFRTLFIGLGGTGGNVLGELRKLMSDTEKAKAHMICIDMDQNDVSKISEMGVKTVAISSSDTVRDVADSLGLDDGVNEWLPQDPVADSIFLASKTDDGASQYRIKSRLCLAKFLRNRNNELAQLLTQLCTVGSTLTKETLRVMIVSSVAGGTGAGTFIQVALYLREFFREKNHNAIKIMGLFACPDLYVGTLSDDAGDESQQENMYSNAYAAVRELNAMNLAVTGGGLAKMDPFYGKSIKMKIDTHSEGLLFDSQSEVFKEDANNKPFDLLYFVDANNQDGGVLTHISQYYKVMADIVYTRLYSPIEYSIRSGESNELGPQSKYPTAIYGSAGYGRLIYPYDDIIRYLSVRKTSEEIGHTWFAFEDAWQCFCTDQMEASAETGEVWNPNPEDRARLFISEMNKGIARKNSRLISLKGMIIDSETEMDRATVFLNALDAALNSGSGLGSSKDGAHCRCQEAEVKKARESTVGKYNGLVENAKTNALSTLSRGVDEFLTSIETYGNALIKKMETTVRSVSNVIIPQSENAAELAEQEKDPMNLFYGLLSVNKKPVHPLAARYLLYMLRDGMNEKLESYKRANMASTISTQKRLMNIAVDDKKSDAIDFTMSDYYEEISGFLVWDKEGKARAALEEFSKYYLDALNAVSNAGNQLFKAAVYEKILEYVNELVAQYEGLFDNLEQYKLELDRKTRLESVRNNGSVDNRCIFVNSSADAKAYIYETDKLTINALREGDQQIASAAGKGIYTALMERTLKKVSAKKNRIITQRSTSNTVDTYSDMGEIFDTVTEIYAQFLREKAPHLKMSAVRAVINECYQVLEYDPARMDAVKIAVLRSKFEEVIEDMIQKSTPMLAFDPLNTETYYKEENGKTETKQYMHIGMHPATLKDLDELYGDADGLGAKEAFEKRFSPTKGLTVHEQFGTDTISCFSAAHCLQPTQILKFRESNRRGYYQYYKKRLALMNESDAMSFTPHLDQRWHLRDAMPYISSAMEKVWRKKTAKAFIYAMLSRNITFTTIDRTECFNFKRPGKSPVLVYWPKKELVTGVKLSRLVEYMEENDELVEEYNLAFDRMVKQLLDVASKNTESVPVYKATLTVDPDLRTLRENLCQCMNYTTSAASKRTKKESDQLSKEAKNKKIKELREASKLLGGDSSVDVLMDPKKSLGGLLQLAWRVHQSEERQDRDKDYGELIIECALEIVEQLCATMYGVKVDTETAGFDDYKDLYNSILEKFMEAFVKYQLVKCNVFTKSKLEKIVGTKGDGDCEVFYRYLKMPRKQILETEEYIWLSQVWLKK